MSSLQVQCSMFIKLLLLLFVLFWELKSKYPKSLHICLFVVGVSKMTIHLHFTGCKGLFVMDLITFAESATCCSLAALDTGEWLTSNLVVVVDTFPKNSKHLLPKKMCPFGLWMNCWTVTIDLSDSSFVSLSASSPVPRTILCLQVSLFH